MNELVIGLQAVSTVPITALFAFFAMCGGRDNESLKLIGLDLWGWDKANRFWGRFFAPFLLGLGIIGLSLWTEHLQWLVFAHILIIGLCLTLGNTSALNRIIKALMFSLAGIPLCMITGLWWLLILQFPIAILAQLILGLKNPLPAPAEEFSIYFLMVVLQPLMLL